MSNNPQSASTLSSISDLARATWRATAGDRLRVGLFIALYVSAYSLDLVVPWIIGWALDVFVKEGLSSESFWHAAWWIQVHIGLKIIFSLLHHYASYLKDVCAFKARFQELGTIFAALVSFPLKWHMHHHSGENLSRLNRSAGAIDAVIRTYIWQIIDGSIKFVVASLAIFMLDYKVAIAVLLMGLVTLMVMFLFNARLARNIRKNNRYNDRINRTCVDYLSNIITVKTLRLEDPAVSYLSKQRGEGLRFARKIAKYQELKWGSIGLGYSLVIGASLLVYFYDRSLLGGLFEVSPVYVLLNYLDKVFGAITSFTGYYSGLVEASISHDDATSILDESDALRAPIRASRFPSDWRKFDLKDVEFSYTGDLLHLKGLSLSVKKGEKIALVGPSGGGKSTLLKVMAGMLQVTKASVEISEISGLDMDDVAGVSLLIPQEPEIFSETVRYNLTLGQEFGQEELDNAVKICCIDYLLKKLPEGWNSNLEEAGLNISVGERQRVALARGVLRLRKKDILLLDEPTSSIDPATEKQIFRGILEQFADRTVIMACHRLALVPLFDRILYVRDGRIEEDGGFNDLITSDGPFAHAWNDYQRHVVKEL